MKEFIDVVKKLWSNKRTRALAILILYLIFFIFVFTLINSMGENTKVLDDSSKVDETIDETKEKDELDYLKNIDIISYRVYDNNDLEVLYFDESLIDTNLIYNLVKNSILESTNYIDNSNTYYISIDDYERIFNNVINNFPGGIRTILKSDTIILDFTEYYGYKINIDIRS